MGLNIYVLLNFFYVHVFRCLASRSFKTTTFLERFQLDPVGLCFFQASWDRSVSNTFTEILGKLVGDIMF